MNKLELIKRLEKYPVFNLNTLIRIINKKREYARLVLYRLKKDKFIFGLEKNKYTLYKDPLIIASNIVWPSYISCWTALRYYNLTEQLPQKVFIITTRARKNNKLKFIDTEFIFIKIKQKYFFGYKKESYQTFSIFIAEPEKAIIDSVLLRKISFSEISEIIKKYRNDLDIKLFVKYLLKLKNKTLIKRFGFLFDKLKIYPAFKLKKFISNKYIFLDYAGPKIGRRNRNWRIIENVRF